MGRNLKIGDMKVEISWNKLDDSWWLDLGISWTEAYYNFNEDGTKRYLDYKNIVTLAFIIFSVHIRW